ncbi:glutaminyl-peptide cyclotransferase [bacterium]|nr:glutaminyl-peptide cyclotransferase [bacterium]
MLKKSFCSLFLLLSVLGVARAGDGNSTVDAQVNREYVLSQKAIPVFGFKVLRSLPHESSSYTEGLVVDGGSVYEGTGRYGRSSLFRKDLSSGRSTKSVDLDARLFGEGVTVMGDRVYQLTYKSNLGLIYDKATLQKVGEFSYDAQGWGLTHNGEELIMSNGSAALVFLDPKNFHPTHSLVVRDDRGPVGFLNELEYVDGQIYANVWQTNLIARVDAKTGKVTGWIDMTGLNPDTDLYQYPFVLNGIAHDASTGRLLVTGKCWPSIWEIELVPKP